MTRTWALSAVLLSCLCASVPGALADTGAVTGKTLFQQKCAACHTLGEGPRIGPDLSGVTKRRDQGWLIRWIMRPDQMLAEKDPVAVALLKEFKQVPMPNLGVTETQAKALLVYVASETEAAAGTSASSDAALPSSAATWRSWFGSVQFAALAVFLLISTVIVAVFWRVALSTRDSVPSIDTKAAYGIRKKLFLGATAVLLCAFGATLPFSPYAQGFQTPDQLVYVAARQFSFTYSSEPITNDADFGRVGLISSLRIPVGELVEFRVTSLDTTHGFAIYGPDGSVFAQTQAMPGYINRLRLRFPAPGKYNVLCLEYCGAAHHLMRSAFVVE